MPEDPRERFRQDLIASQGNFALRNQRATARRVIDALSSKNFRDITIVNRGFLILGALLLGCGGFGLLVIFADLFKANFAAPMIQNDIYPTLFGTLVAGIGLALILSARQQSRR